MKRFTPLLTTAVLAFLIGLTLGRGQVRQITFVDEPTAGPASHWEGPVQVQAVVKDAVRRDRFEVRTLLVFRPTRMVRGDETIEHVSLGAMHPADYRLVLADGTIVYGTRIESNGDPP